MTNRERYILRQNEYDLLLTMQSNIVSNGSTCVLDMLTDSMIPCPKEMCSKVGSRSVIAVCSKCIQEFLNKESENNGSKNPR